MNKSKKTTWLLGFLGFLGLMGFQAFQQHNPWLLFYFSFFFFFSAFRYKRENLKYLGLLAIPGVIIALLGVLGLFSVWKFQLNVSNLPPNKKLLTFIIRWITKITKLIIQQVIKKYKPVPFQQDTGFLAYIIYKFIIFQPE